MKTLLALAAALVLAAPMTARAEEKSGSPSFHASASETHNFKILAIDKANRIVTLVSETGDTVGVKCGKEVRNFPQLRVGDDVVTKYTESYTIHVEPKGEFEDTKETAMARAKEGGTPGANIVETRRVSAKITDINKTKGTVTFQTMSGESFTVKPQNPNNLNKVEVGNYIVATQQLGHAISVSKPKANKKKY